MAAGHNRQLAIVNLLEDDAVYVQSLQAFGANEHTLKAIRYALNPNPRGNPGPGSGAGGGFYSILHMFISRMLTNLPPMKKVTSHLLSRLDAETTRISWLIASPGLVWLRGTPEFPPYEAGVSRDPFPRWRHYRPSQLRNLYPTLPTLGALTDDAILMDSNETAESRELRWLYQNFLLWDMFVRFTDMPTKDVMQHLIPPALANAPPPAGSNLLYDFTPHHKLAAFFPLSDINMPWHVLRWKLYMTAVTGQCRPVPPFWEIPKPKTTSVQMAPRRTPEPIPSFMTATQIAPFHGFIGVSPSLLQHINSTWGPPLTDDAQQQPDEPHGSNVAAVSADMALSLQQSHLRHIILADPSQAPMMTVLRSMIKMPSATPFLLPRDVGEMCFMDIYTKLNGGVYSGSPTPLADDFIVDVRMIFDNYSPTSMDARNVELTFEDSVATLSCQTLDHRHITRLSEGLDKKGQSMLFELIARYEPESLQALLDGKGFKFVPRELRIATQRRAIELLLLRQRVPKIVRPRQQQSSRKTPRTSEPARGPPPPQAAQDPAPQAHPDMLAAWSNLDTRSAPPPGGRPGLLYNKHCYGDFCGDVDSLAYVSPDSAYDMFTDMPP